MSSLSSEYGKLIVCQSKPIPIRQLFGRLYELNMIEIPKPIAHEFDLKDGDCLIWRYYDKAKVVVISKRERRLARETRPSREMVKK